MILTKKEFDSLKSFFDNFDILNIVQSKSYMELWEKSGCLFCQIAAALDWKSKSGRYHYKYSYNTFRKKQVRKMFMRNITALAGDELYNTFRNGCYPPDMGMKQIERYYKLKMEPSPWGFILKVLKSEV